MRKFKLGISSFSMNRDKINRDKAKLVKCLLSISANLSIFQDIQSLQYKEVKFFSGLKLLFSGFNNNGIHDGLIKKITKIFRWSIYKINLFILLKLDVPT